MHTPPIALVVGGNGGIGRETCLALRRHGWQVHALVRRPPGDLAGIRWIEGDAMQRGAVQAAAEGASLIVHAVNPPGYRQWDALVLPMLDNTIAAAAANRARVVLPGTIYNFGPDAFPLLREDSPQHPLTRKGEIRAEMERRLAHAAQDGVRTLILRCGDFIGPRIGNWFSQGMVRGGSPVKALRYPAAFDLPHAWAYLPDVAETLARLLERESELADVEAFHFGGYWLDGVTMAQAVRRAANDPDIVLRRFPWWLVTLAAPFVETLREMRKMRYLWRTPIRLDDARLRAFLGDAPYTPIDDALRATLAAMGCLATSSVVPETR